MIQYCAIITDTLLWGLWLRKTLLQAINSNEHLSVHFRMRNHHGELQPQSHCNFSRPYNVLRESISTDHTLQSATYPISLYLHIIISSMLVFVLFNSSFYLSIIYLSLYLSIQFIGNELYTFTLLRFIFL